MEGGGRKGGIQSPYTCPIHDLRSNPVDTRTGLAHADVRTRAQDVKVSHECDVGPADKRVTGEAANGKVREGGWRSSNGESDRRVVGVAAKGKMRKGG
jgi:hypothetical protein